MTDYKLVPVEPTAEMAEAAQDAYMPFGDMEMAIRMAVLAAPDHVADARKKIGRPQIREAFLRNGARIEPDRDDLPDYVYESVFELLELAAPAVQGEPVAWMVTCIRPDFGEPIKALHSVQMLADEQQRHWEGRGCLVYQTPLYTAPQPAEQQPAPDVAGLVEVLETALFGTPLDDVPNRDNDDIWCMCYPHLPERASDALRDHLARIETALAAHRKQGGE